MKLFFEGFDINNFDDCVEEAYKFIDMMYHRGMELEDIESAFERALVDYETWGPDEDLDEAVIHGREVDLTNKPGTIAYELPNASDEIQKILSDVEYKYIPFEEGKRKIIELFRGMEGVNDAQKRQAIARLNNARNSHNLASAVTTFWVGDKVITNKRYYH